MTSKTSTWVGGTAVLAMLILVATWFVGVSPTIAATSTAHAAADASETRNVQLQADLDRLAQQFAELDASKAELAAIERQIPTAPQLAEYVRTVQTIADEVGVTFIGYNAGEPELVVPVEAEVPAEPATTDDAEATADPEAEVDASAEVADTATAVTPAGFVPIEGFVGMAATLKVIGAPDKVSAFVERVQATERLFLVTGYTGEGLDPGEPEQGRPQINEGDMEMAVVGYLYGLAQSVPAGSVPTEEPTLAPLPGGAAPRMGSSR
ncbi:hypothetical protein [Cellulomonas wangsupingiae]|uniref:Pilus assembly protein PilO n=1 Tax=Cellulomonas wangsupingiae TaxID=2968085 RepID=A0ABY5JZZ4_9CELL|nr:hypothetical protein [Cellulomonas wangsupingiae]MCC2333208.1 hypothetical protein [Cellulomonas wangsupingiae]UUI63418.1 hypothetical protein NP075_09560 [Cellulomonas wangsupingiae]